MAKLTKFDPADYLDSPESMAAYLTEACETGDGEFIAEAIGNVARAKGMSSIAEETGLSRQGLYKSLSADGHPELATVTKVLDTLGLQLSVTPKAA